MEPIEISTIQTLDMECLALPSGIRNFYMIDNRLERAKKLNASEPNAGIPNLAAQQLTNR
jgi:hypothetical protein